MWYSGQAPYAGEATVSPGGNAVRELTAGPVSEDAGNRIRVERR